MRPKRRAAGASTAGGDGDRHEEQDQHDRNRPIGSSDGAHVGVLHVPRRPAAAAATPRRWTSVAGSDGPAGIVSADAPALRTAARAHAREAVDGLPSDDGWLFEPKWDGFRAIVFRDGDEVFTQSRDLKPLDRYFPELAEPLRAALPERCVLDGEVVIARDGALAFEALLLRIHPAASRVKMLAAESPASFVAWDLLALGDEDLRDGAARRSGARGSKRCSGRPNRRST